MLAHLIRFVKNFFRFFSNFFDVLLSRSGLAPFITQLLYATTGHSVCQELFSVLFKFLDFGIFFAALADSFDILAQLYRFVKHYLQILPIFFGVFLQRTAGRFGRTTSGWTGDC